MFEVYYFLDEEPTPYMTVLPIPCQEATLAHFKKSVPKKGVAYYTKVLDPDIGKYVVLRSNF